MNGGDASERAASDAAADLIAEEAQGGFAASKDAQQSAPAAAPASGAPLMTREDATHRLGPNVLAALEAKFNGSLTDVRYPDENDMLF